MLRSILRAAAAGSKLHHQLPRPSAAAALLPCLSYSSKNSKSAVTKANKKAKSKDGRADNTSSTASDDLDSGLDEGARARHLALDESDSSLDVGPDGRPLFTSTSSLSHLTRKDACTYFNFNMSKLEEVLPEGLPAGMEKEFGEAMRSAVLVRQGFLDLRDNFRRIVDPPSWPSDKAPKLRKQVVLDGPVSCGKSIALAMLVHWARDEGWLVFYVPKGREWTHGGFYYKNPQTGLWDTPVQAEKILKDFRMWNEGHLMKLPCQVYDPIPLGEGAGVGWMKDVDSMTMPEGSTLDDLVKTGIDHTHAAVGVVVRLRKELSLVKEIPVLFAIDQYNSWFTFSEYEVPVTLHSCRPLHAREVATVNAFRSMMHDNMMVGAFSHSTAVGKLRKDLPDVPADARVNFPRYSLDEAATVCHYYLRQRLVRREAFSEENWKKVYYLSNGNGSEMRWLIPLMR
ncbi:uncharacterized protein LOC116199409 [Punica granatum]|uniref:Small ribosomal subunit protein mS29 n=2 Tax=Punica granatum TaxID=22663 RepID=A0A6P8CMV2_PUNGR|nr:uncharacterized protein LOC116199409 [Punica granatum]XP_031385607.1 uncharacterized protein LOC116199409 [Punica granatum]